MSHALTRIRNRAGLPADIHLHSLRHFHATALDPVISEAQKQHAWAGRPCTWRATTPMVSQLRTDAAEHIGQLLG
jgi:integrase